MTKEEIEREVELYQDYCSFIKNIESGLNTGIEWYRDKFPDLCQKFDFRPGTLGRYLASLISIRFSLNNTYQYVQRPDWDKDFLENYQPEFAKPNRYLGFFQSIDHMHRFYLFHSIFHQWETTLRIVHEALKLKSGKPTDIVNNELNVYAPDLLKCIYAVRNTIHNNGYYKPLGKEPLRFTYKNQTFETTFIENEKIDLNTGKVLVLLEELIIQSEKLLKHPRILALPIITDRS